MKKLTDTHMILEDCNSAIKRGLKAFLSLQCELYVSVYKCMSIQSEGQSVWRFPLTDSRG